MACLNNRLSYATWRLKVFHQLFRPNGVHPAAYRTFSTSSDGSPTPTPDEPSTSTSTPSDAQEPAQKQEQEEEAVENESSFRPSELLPQSPLITNPRPGHDKLHRRKRRPDYTETDIHLNPWAQALASPLRACKLTGERMPRALLTEWGCLQRPDAPEKLWLLPTGLFDDKLQASASSSPLEYEQENQSVPRDHRLRLLSLRMVDRLPLLRTVTDTYWSMKHGRKRQPLAKLIPHRWKQPLGPMTARDEDRLLWREDMPEFTLRMMRQDVLKWLKIATDESAKWAETRKVWTEIPMRRYGRGFLARRTFGMEPFHRVECSAVLVLNRKKAKPGKYTGLYPRMPNEVYVSTERRLAPVFDLTVMLSEAELQELREYHPRFENTALLFRPDNQATVDAMLALWKLRGFIRDDPVLEPAPMAFKLKSIWRTNYLM
ncbi:uncharacterized protein BO80DRAFT_423387 [Aspergillus ibericus CBS 121593]|uniref:Uncharacterized protein n=1 Tax=Aspergillus ibericus CBS 121593 TaxID=1448316 RepID=A0A395H5F8_9EURO|nr:hypothetical protein BO80DRAFT_423387 [Aspergillus ibericus CBS 121593]RAL02930.1 hypothetical protein BO80DRAFT_423387 [Aspergillus ibericus CBS 121593]